MKYLPFCLLMMIVWHNMALKWVTSLDCLILKFLKPSTLWVLMVSFGSCKGLLLISHQLIFWHNANMMLDGPLQHNSATRELNLKIIFHEHVFEYVICTYIHTCIYIHILPNLFSKLCQCMNGLDSSYCFYDKTVEKNTITSFYNMVNYNHFAHSGTVTRTEYQPDSPWAIYRVT